MDLLSRYSSVARFDTTGVSWQFYCDAKTNSLRKLLKKIKLDPTVGSRVKDLLSRYSGLVGGLAEKDAVGIK